MKIVILKAYASNQFNVIDCITLFITLRSYSDKDDIKCMIFVFMLKYNDEKG